MGSLSPNSSSSAHLRLPVPLPIAPLLPAAFPHHGSHTHRAPELTNHPIRSSFLSFLLLWLLVVFFFFLMFCFVLKLIVYLLILEPLSVSPINFLVPDLFARCSQSIAFTKFSSSNYHYHGLQLPDPLLT